MNVPANRPVDPLVRLNTQLTSRADQFAMVLPSHISPDKFQRTILTAVQSDPELLRADRTSLILACMKAAQDGLLPDKREAALVIFKRNFKDADGGWQQALEVAYMPMVYGLRKKILQSREITDIKVAVVYRRELIEGYFIYEEGTEAMLRHKPMLDMSEDDAKDDNIVAAYSMATHKDGTKTYEVMRRFEIDKVRESSQTGATKDRNGKPRRSTGPWVDWYPEQAKKTVMRRHSKVLPQSGDIIVDVEARELDLMARSTTLALASEAPPPVALPGDPRAGAAPMVTDQSGTESGVQIDDAAIDAEMQSLRDPATGMTVVSEEEARTLDAAQSGYDEGHDAETGEVIPEGAGVDPYRGEVWAERRREILDLFNTAETVTHVRAADELLVRHLQGFPGEIQQELEKAATEARNRFKKPTKA